MSVASPPEIDVCDGIEDDDNDNRRCHLVNSSGQRYCGRISRGVIGPIHPTNPYADTCNNCGLRRCAECVVAYLAVHR